MQTFAALHFVLPPTLCCYGVLLVLPQTLSLCIPCSFLLRPYFISGFLVHHFAKVACSHWYFYRVYSQETCGALTAHAITKCVQPDKHNQGNSKNDFADKVLHMKKLLFSSLSSVSLLAKAGQKEHTCMFTEIAFSDTIQRRKKPSEVMDSFLCKPAVSVSFCGQGKCNFSIFF